MTRIRDLGVVICAAWLAAGCATYGNYQPTVDTMNDPNAESISRDQADCRELARQASGGAAAETAKGAIVGGLIGAAGGAAIGAIAGEPGTGAAVGAAAGGLGAGTYKGLSADEAYKAAYRDCMRNRGHNVLG
jgi:uncharacterized protein YcfJ